MAEIIPFEPDTDNAGVGSGDTITIIRAISYVSKGVWLFLVRLQFRKRSAAELVSRTIPEAKRSGIRDSNCVAEAQRNW